MAAKKKASKKKATPRKAAARKRKKAAAKPVETSASDNFVILLNQPRNVDTPNAAIKLPAHCTKENVAELREQLLAAINSGERTTLSASAVQEIDTASLQVLCCFAKTAGKKDLTFSWEHVSDPFLQAMRHTGMTENICPGFAGE